MNVTEFHTLMHSLSEELRVVAGESTTETWPANRDKVLLKYGCTDLNFLTLT